MDGWNVYHFSIKGPDFEGNLKKDIEKMEIAEDYKKIVVLIKAFEKFRLDSARRITDRIFSFFNPDAQCLWSIKIDKELKNEVIIQLIVM